MNGWDFNILWNAGQAVLHGQDPYSVASFYYPLPFAYALTIPALFPVTVAFGIWLVINLGLLIYFLRRPFWQWLLYIPVMHLFASGQVELLWWSMERGVGRHWRGALLGALMTLKPQAAFVLLSWHLFDWLRHDRRTLLRWILATTALWGIPLLWRPNWIQDWLKSLALNSEGAGSGLVQSMSNTPGIFSLLRIAPSVLPVLIIAAIVIVGWGLFQRKEVARAAALIGNPGGLFYASLALLDTAPAWLLVPLSIIAVIITLLTQTFIGFLLLPIAVIGWWAKKGRLKQDKPLIRKHSNPTLETSPTATIEA